MGGDAGKWLVKVENNPVGDTSRVILALDADTGVGRFGGRVRMIVRCQSNKTELYIDWTDYLGDDDHDVYASWKNVLVRVGTAPAETGRWNISTDNTATFAPEPITLLRRMAKADSLLAQTTPYNESPVTAMFNIRGLTNALKPLMKTCGWSLAVGEASADGGNRKGT